MSFSEIRSRVLSHESFNRNPISDEEYVRQASLARPNLVNLFPDEVYETPISIPLAEETSLDHFRRTQEDNISSLRQIMLSLAFINLTLESADWFHNHLHLIVSEKTIYRNLIPAIGALQFKDSHTLKLDGRRKFFKFANQFLSLCGNIVDLSLVEKIRLAQSQVSSNRILKGTLRLSTRPEDFLSLSEGTTGWHTCLSLFPHQTKDIISKHPGDYRAGCLEMMTSPYTILATVESNHRKYWRQIILLTPYAIIALRGYPYTAPQVTSQVLSLVATAAKRSLDWDYDPQLCYSKSSEFAVSGGSLYLTTERMYNDSYLGGYYLIGKKPLPVPTYEINYSGSAYCLSCGAPLELDIGYESEILCPSCSHRRLCLCCGEMKDLDSLLFDKTLDDYICFYCDELSRAENRH